MDFPLTEWSLVARATLEGGTAGRAALEKLCRDYWRPVRDFLLCRGWSERDAEDLTQEFFRQLVSNRAWHRADQQRGKFRSFLLGVLMRVLARERRFHGAEKRSAGQPVLSIDALEEAGMETAEEAGDSEAEQQFDEAWAARIMEAAMDGLADEWKAAGRGADFTVLMNYLPLGREAPEYADSSVALGLSPTALRSAVARLRQRFRELVQAEVARTVSAPHEVAAELRHLCSVMMAPGFQITLRATSAAPAAEKEEA